MTYTLGEYRIDPGTFEIWRGDEQLPVEPQVLELLLFLIERRQHVVSKEEIFEHVWKGRVVSESALSSRIKAARKLLGDDGNRQAVIRTIYGRGFRFVGKLSNSPPGSPASSDAQTGKPAHSAAHTHGYAQRKDQPLSEAQSPEALSASHAAASPPPSLTAWQSPSTRYVAVSEVHVAYQIFGQGPLNLVIVPGFISNVEICWESPECTAWLRSFAEYARVVMFDKRGTGLSDRVTDLPSMDERMEDVRAVMDAAGMESAALLGISEGGSLAALFAASHPNRCRSLILCGSFARALDPSEEGIQRFAKYVRSHWGKGKSLDRAAPSQVGNSQFQRWWGRFERMGASHAAVIDLVRMNSQIDILDILPSIHVPTLVVHRSRDALIDIAAGKVLSENIPGAQLLSLDSEDHIPWVGAPVAEELRQMRSFLEARARTGQAGAEAELVLRTVVVVDQRAAGGEQGHREHLAQLVQSHAGSPALHMGGCWLTSFDAPGRAVRFAAAVRDALPSARVGVHTGEVRLSTHGIEGLAVSLASDIARRAAPGQAVVSRTVTDLVVGSRIRFSDLGAHALEGAPSAWHLYEVTE